MAKANCKNGKWLASLIRLHGLVHEVAHSAGVKCRAGEGSAAPREHHPVEVFENNVELAFWRLVGNVNDFGPRLLEELDIGGGDIGVISGGVLREGGGLGENSDHGDFLRLL